MKKIILTMAVTIMALVGFTASASASTFYGPNTSIPSYNSSMDWNIVEYSSPSRHTVAVYQDSYNVFAYIDNHLSGSYYIGNVHVYLQRYTNGSWTTIDNLGVNGVDDGEEWKIKFDNIAVKGASMRLYVSYPDARWICLLHKII